MEVHVKSSVSKELWQFANQDSKFSSDVCMNNLRDFDWDDAVAEADTHMPTLVGILNAVLPNARPALIGHTIATILYSRRPKKFKFVPTVSGIELWRSGGSVRCMSSFNGLAVTSGVKGTRAAVDNLNNENAGMLQTWKSEVEVGLY